MRNKELADLQRKVEREFDLYNMKWDELKVAYLKKEALEEQKKELTLILGYFNKLVDKKRKEVMDKVVSIVTYGMQTVFRDSTIVLKVQDKIQRNQKFYSIVVERNGIVEDNWNDTSGGLRDVLQFMLRVVFLIVSSNRRFLVLDEPFKGLSTEYRENLGDFLVYLAEKFDVQFFIVSHQVEIDKAADKLYEIKNIEGNVQILPIEV